MSFRTLLLITALTALAAFALLNWTTFTTPTSLTLGITRIEAPLGLVMLAFTGLISALFLVYIVFQQASSIRDARIHAKALKAQRALADQAEASRLATLQDQLTGVLANVQTRAAANANELKAHIDALEKRLTDKIDESTRTASAYLGEIDDKLDRLVPPARF